MPKSELIGPSAASRFLKIPVITTHDKKCGKNTMLCTNVENALFFTSAIITARNTGNGNRNTIFITLMISVFIMYL